MREPFGRSLWLAVVLLLCTGGVGWASRIYVDADAAGAKDGTSWSDAFTDLQAALAAADPGDEVWVAAGIYRPSASDRRVSFVLRSRVEVYGGFAGTETGLDQRDWTAHPTILSGDIAGNDGPTLFEGDTENSYHVVVAGGTDATAVLDGFTIMGGHADGQSPYLDGAGLYLPDDSNPTLRNLIFRRNRAENSYGGGLYTASGSAPTLINCRFLDNAARNGGGAALGGPAKLSHSHFAGNRAYFGAGLFVLSSAPEMEDCTIAENVAEVDGFTGYGGGLYAYYANPVLEDCIVVRNEPTDLDTFGEGSGPVLLRSEPQ